MTGEYGPLVWVPGPSGPVQAFAERPRSLGGLLRLAAQRWPERVAAVTPSGTVTYAALDTRVDMACRALGRLGVEAGERIALALGHDLSLYAAPFVASRLGVTALLLNTTLGAPRWREQLERAGARLVMADASTRAAVEAAAPPGVALQDVDDVFGTGPAGLSTDAARPVEDVPQDEDWPLVVLATSGTTGIPKTTTVTSRGLIHAALGYVELLGLRTNPPERSLVVLPLHYIGPLSAQTTAMALIGGTCVLPGDTRPKAALQAMAEHRITHVDAVPAWLGLLARESDRPVLPGWRTLIYGGAPMPAETAATIGAAWTGCALWDVWGLSETHGPATARRVEPARPADRGDVGRPLPGVQVRVAPGTDSADPVTVPADGDPVATIGELQVRGGNVTPGYLDDPEATAAVLRDGWLSTGDLGTVAEDGTVRVLDRGKDVILRGGSNVFSIEVEQVLCAASGVAEAAVYGVADGLGGEAVAAAVVLTSGAVLDAGALRRRVRDQVGTHAVPRRVVAVAALPRNPTGKIDKRRLREDNP